MKNISNILGSFYMVLILVSCGDKKADNKILSQQETPKALEDSKIDYKSYSRSGDLVDELYQEIVDNSPALQKLENDYEDFKYAEVKDVFNNYHLKSNGYYNAANYKTTSITDSLLRQKINELLSSSHKNYTSKTSEFDSFIKQIDQNGSTLKNHHNVLKIVLTLPFIEKYQADKMPDKKPFQDLIKQQKNLILQTDSLTPKF